MGATSASDPVDAERVRRAARQRLFGEPIAPLALGRFLVRELLGAGGMGVVYAAFDPKLERTVAIKLLLDRSGGDQLLGEARTMALVRHPGLPAVYEVGEWEGQVFLAMEHVQGPTLRRWLQDRPRSPAEVIGAFVEVGRALAALHGAGLVHRDFKPDNVVMTPKGRALLVDFGLARPAGVGDGSIAGTLPYLAPELAAGAGATPASDQYAFCVALADTRVTLPPAARVAVERGRAPRPADRHRDLDALCDLLATDPRARRRRILTITGVGLLVTAAAVAVVMPRGASSAACSDGGDRVAVAWGAARRDAVLAAFDATGLPYASTSRDAAVARLDRYARTWQTAHLDACEATHVRHEQSAELLDLRMICLERRRAALAAAATVLARADAGVVERAVALTEALPPIEACADGAALRATLPPPGSQDVRDGLVALEPKRAEVTALTLAGDFTRGIATAEALVSDARALGYRPFEAEALLALGTAQSISDAPAAGATLFEALKAGQASGHREVVTRASTRLISFHAVRGRFGEAETFSGLAEASLEAAGGDPRLQLALDDAMMPLLLELDRPDEARGRAEAALAVLDGLDEDVSVQRAAFLGNLGDALGDLGRYDDALARLRESLALRERILGATHPDIARTLNRMAVFVEKVGKFTDALALYQRGAEVAAAGLGDDSQLYAALLDNQAGVLREVGRDDEALTLRLRALQIREAVAPGTTDLAISYNNVGVILEEGGQYEEARRYHQRALDLRVTIYGEDHSEVATSWMNLGDVSYGEKDYPAALASHARAVGILERKLSKVHPDLVYPLTGMAKAQLAAGDPGAAVATLERAIVIASKSDAYPGEEQTARELLEKARRAIRSSALPRPR